MSFVVSITAKVTLVLAAALLVTHLMRRRPAAERHLVWVVAAVAVLLVPVLTVLAPPLRISIAAPAWLSAAASDNVAPVAPTAAASDMTVAPAPVAQSAPTPALVAPRTAAANARIAAPAPFAETPAAEAALATPSTAPRRSVTIPVVLFMIWLAGALVVSARLGLDFAHVHILARRARKFSDAALAVRARGVAAQLGVTGTVRLLEGTPHMMPMTFGIARPTLLLPSTAHTWTAARQTAVLRHELAHIRRRDSLTQLVAELGCVVYWFHPLMWLASRDMCMEREHACDDAVIAAGSRTWEYAAELLDIARATRPARSTALAAIAMARPSQLRARLAAVLEERPRQARVSTKLLVPAWIGAALVVLPLAAVTPTLQQPAAQDAWTPLALVQQSAPQTQPNAQPASRAQLHANTAVESQPTREPDAHARVLSSNSSQSSSLVMTDLTALPALAGSTPGALTMFGTSQLAAVQDDCLRGKLNNVNHNSNDDRRTMKWSGPGCSGELIIEGRVDFDPDFTRIVGLSRDGYLRLTTDEGRVERRLVMRPNGNGVTHEYSVDGDRRAFDSAAQAWLDNHMMFMFRRMGFMAKERATAILERRGSDALLTEVGLLQGDYVRAAYLEVLVAQGRLDEASLRRVLTLAGNSVDSDHYRHQIVTSVAGRYNFTDGVRGAYIDAVSRMKSDHYKHSAFDVILKKGNLTPTQTSAVLREANRIGSDHYRAALLEGAIRTYVTTPEIRAAYLEAASGISSDHYKANVLTRVLKDNLTATEVARVVTAASTISSDHYRSQVLGQIASTGLKDPALQRTFVRALGGIGSDHYLQNLLSAVVKRESLDRDALLAVLEAAESLGSDHYRAQLLVDIAKKYQLEGDARARFIRLMDGLGNHYRGTVASEFIKQVR